MNLNDLLLEGSSVDYKEALEIKKPRSWLKSVSAFANSFGGHIVFGVRDNPREVCGLDNPQEVISKITELIKARIDPTPRYQLHAFSEDDKICIDLEIQNAPAYPYYYRFEGVCVAYIRNGDQSEETSRQQLSALILKRPSCGLRRSAMSRSDMILMRETIALWSGRGGLGRSIKAPSIR